jgi:2-polyprenyl-3-methyl-5-hydroxy-6-metoxy-1,4-benzoquinol methylase
MSKHNKNDGNIDSSLEGEAEAFDRQILERVEHGHVPDLRHNKKTEWFYNNVWRDPELVKMSFLENINFLLPYLEKNSKVLEVGCGPGHNSLELARHGHYVTGVDLSPMCIEVARKTFSQNPYRDGFGSLDYYAGDFQNLDIPGSPFDAVLCYGTLSHFPDLDRVLDRISNLLSPSGTILVWDTSIDLYSKNDASILYLIRSILSFTGHYYNEVELPEDESSLAKEIDIVLNELMYHDEKGSNVQSPNDNCNTHQEIIACLDGRFERTIFTPEACFYRNLIGGIRFKQQKDQNSMAYFIMLLENSLIKSGMLSPAFFYYVGTKK